MKEPFSKREIDQLGDRLRALEMSGSGSVVIPEADHQLLNAYRYSFDGAYENVFATVQSNLGLEPTGRQPKTIGSIISKLKRQPTTRLSQMQDIAGCRVVIPAVNMQDGIVSQVVMAFRSSKIDDRRASPSFGYRAVHVIVQSEGKAVEIQVRTPLQQGWAEVSEKLADIFGIDTKYGQGPDPARRVLDGLSEAISLIEGSQLTLATVPPYDKLRQLWRRAIRESWYRRPLELVRLRRDMWMEARKTQSLATDLKKQEDEIIGIIAEILDVAQGLSKQE